MTLNSIFRDNLRAALEASDQPLKAIASRSGYSGGYISAIAHGHKINPTLSFVDAMAEVLGVDLSALLGARQ